MLVAEELDVSLKQMRLKHAPPIEKLYANPMLKRGQAAAGVVDLGLGCAGEKISAKSCHTRQFLCIFASNSMQE
jgi:hypothetical protein